MKFNHFLTFPLRAMAFRPARMIVPALLLMFAADGLPPSVQARATARILPGEAIDFERMGRGGSTLHLETELVDRWVEGDRDDEAQRVRARLVEFH